MLLSKVFTDSIAMPKWLKPGSSSRLGIPRFHDNAIFSRLKFVYLNHLTAKDCQYLSAICLWWYLYFFTIIFIFNVLVLPNKWVRNSQRKGNLQSYLYAKYWAVITTPVYGTKKFATVVNLQLLYCWNWGHQFKMLRVLFFYFINNWFINIMSGRVFKPIWKLSHFHIFVLINFNHVESSRLIIK